MKKITFLLAFIVMGLIAPAQKNNKPANPPVKPFILGEIREIDSKILNEKRVLNIYLPEGYKPSDSIRYPVIYLLDGSADEDFIHIVGIVQFNNFSWINRVPKSIIVGIANIDRRRDFTFPTSIEEDKKHSPTSGKSANFINFIENELQPYINKTYKTTGSKTLIGESLGGLLATEILFTKPRLFENYIIISPSVWWNNESLLSNPADSLKTLKSTAKIYIGVGKEGLAPTTIPHIMEIDANLLIEKLQRLNNPNIKVYYDYLPEENHATVTHQAVFNAFRLLYPVSK